MKSKIISKKRLELSLVFALVFAILIGLSHFEVACENMKSNVLRLHIIANSDSKEDQDLKLLVRDEILRECGYLFCENTNIEDAITIAENSLDLFNSVANSVIKKSGYEYLAQSEVGMSYFETREYENFTLPAGEYKSLIIRLGEARGKNWWCVVFPTVCLPTAYGDIEDSVCSESGRIAKQPQNYVMRFKIVEIYEEIKNFIKK